MTSSMPERMYLVRLPTRPMAMVKPGRTRCLIWMVSYPIGAYPRVGNQPSHTAKNRISSSPTQKLGAAMPNSDTALMPLSIQVNGRVPAITPRVMPRATPMMTPVSASGRLFWNFCQTRGPTGFWDCMATPKSRFINVVYIHR